MKETPRAAYIKRKPRNLYTDSLQTVAPSLLDAFLVL